MKKSDQLLKKLVMWLPFLWLVVGFLTVSSVVYGYQVLIRSGNQTQQTKKIQHPILSNKETQELQKDKIRQGDFNESQIKPVSPEAYADAQLHYEKLVNDWGIGSIFISSSNIHSKILAGMSNENLMVGLGTYYPDQILGQGNYVMMAHNLIYGGGILLDLPKTSVGSVVFATDFTTIFEYVVDVNQTVSQSEGHLLDKPKKGAPALLTIFRCEGGLHTTNRALVQAKFHKSYPVSEGTHIVKENLGLEKSVRSSDGKVADEVSGGNKKLSDPEKEKETARTENNSKKFLVNEPVYNSVDLLSIRLYSLVNSSPLLVGFVFILGMFFFVYISNHIKKVNR